MRVALDKVVQITDNIKTFWFRSDVTPNNVSGQFIEMRLPHKDTDDRGDKRWFTLSSSPTEGNFAITTKFAGDKGSSFKKTLDSLKPGQTLTLSQPMGDFVLPKDKSIPLVFVAGGIGVTPMRSMVKWLKDNGEKRTIQLIYSANSIDEVAFLELFKSYEGLDLIIVPSTPPKNWSGPSGRLDAETLLKIIGETKGKLIYMSGPEPMVEALGKGLEKSGVPKNKIIVDYFPGYAKI